MRGTRTTVPMILLVLATWALPASAQDAGLDFAVEPAKGSETASEGNYFVIKTEPGTRVRQAIVVRNLTDRRLDLSIAPVDSFTNEAGAVDYEDPSMDADAVGAWIEISSPVIRLPGGGSERVPFTISIPDGARTGVNLGAISIQPVEDETSGRAVVAVQVNTPGELVPEIVVSGVTGRSSEQGAFLDIELANIGTRFASGRGTLILSEEGIEFPIEINAFVPGTSTVYRVMWEGDVPSGELPAAVEIPYGDGFTAEWSGTISFARAAEGGSAPVERSEGGDAGIVVIVVAALAALAAAFYLGLWRARAATVPRVDEKPWRSFTPKKQEAQASETDSTPLEGGPPDASEPAGMPSEVSAEAPADEPVGTTAPAAVADLSTQNGSKQEATLPTTSIEALGDEPAEAAPTRSTEDDNAPSAAEGKGPSGSARKKPAAKKTTRKKAARKKSTAKKTTAKKTTRRKTSTKKTARKKSTAKKTTSRKSTATRSAVNEPASGKGSGGRASAAESRTEVSGDLPGEPQDLGAPEPEAKPSGRET